MYCFLTAVKAILNVGLRERGGGRREGEGRGEKGGRGKGRGEEGGRGKGRQEEGGGKG